MPEVTVPAPAPGMERKVTAGHVAKVVVAVGMPVALLFGVAGTWDWPGAWAYLVFLIGGGTAALRIMARRHPDLIRERAERWREGKRWDRPFLLVIGLLGPAAVQLVCGLDKRFGWSAPPTPVVSLTAAIVFVAGAALTAWAIAVNPFFAAVVRIQTDRGHHAIARGPYAYVRHPGYAGMLVCTIASPALLGTWWGLAPALLLAATVIARTALEDRTLRAELPGYTGYVSRVRHRLVPGMW